MATGIVDALKAQGHILVVKGGSTPLVKELDERMSSHLDAIVLGIVPRASVGGEVTSTFGNEAVDEAVEQVVEQLTRTLMDSDHVEDVFAEDNVIQRDIFRIVRDTLLHRHEVEGDDEDELPILVRLDTLGYVASTVGKLAGDAMLREALDRAASAIEAQLASYNTPTREATFLLEGGGPDRRLELEEAVADELSDLVDAGFVELPTIERRLELDQDTTSRERITARPRIELAAVKTIMRSGCAATWEFIDPRTIKVTFTPLSEQDAGDIDQYMPQFARKVALLFEGSGVAQATDIPRASRSTRLATPQSPPAVPEVIASEAMKSPNPAAHSAAQARSPESKEAARHIKARNGAKRMETKPMEVMSDVSEKRAKTTGSSKNSRDNESSSRAKKAKMPAKKR